MDHLLFFIFKVFGIVSNWTAQSLKDGRITYYELLQLGIQVAEVLCLPIDDEVIKMKELIEKGDD